MCYARVLDAERKFLEAAQHYKALSQSGGAFISEGDMLRTLELAVTCAILAKAGPPRSRVLAMLFSDERSQNLPNFALLNKVRRTTHTRARESVLALTKGRSAHRNTENCRVSGVWCPGLQGAHHPRG